MHGLFRLIPELKERGWRIAEIVMLGLMFFAIIIFFVFFIYIMLLLV